MSELRDRLERLAARGSRRGADDVLQRRDARRADDEVGRRARLRRSRSPIVDDDVPFVTAEPESRVGRGRFGTLVAAFGVAALVGVGALAVTVDVRQRGRGLARGCGPAARRRDLAQGSARRGRRARRRPRCARCARRVNARDATRRRPEDRRPGEPAARRRRPFRRPSRSSRPSRSPTATPRSRSRAASSRRARTRPRCRSCCRTRSATPTPTDTKAKVDLARLASNSDLPTFVVTVRHDGRWYVSPAYTALEYAREADGGPAADVRFRAGRRSSVPTRPSAR